MNLQLGEVLRDVMGKTGQAIIRAIVAGERDPKVLAAHRPGRVKCSEARDCSRADRQLARGTPAQALSMFDMPSTAYCRMRLEDRGAA